MTAGVPRPAAGADIDNGTGPGSARGPAAWDNPQALRTAGPELLSLALLDARNHLLQTLAAFDAPGVPAALHREAWGLALRSGAWQARWVLGLQNEGLQDGGLQVGGQQEGGPQDGGPRHGHDRALPAAGDAARAWLADVLEAGLDRLQAGGPGGVVDVLGDSPGASLGASPTASTGASPSAFAATAEVLPDVLHRVLPWHMALQHEDRLTERLVALLQRVAPPPRSQRAPLWLPAQRWQLGSGTGTLPGVPFNQWGALDVALPECEIDAQAVNWQQFAEFAVDGGYDRPELWGDAGWAWLQQQAEPRRAPRHVAQLAGGVLVQRGLGVSLNDSLGVSLNGSLDGSLDGVMPAGLQRAPAGQAAMHLSRFEAQAWCRWAGRRLPTEAEWELAAATAGSRGFVWGDVYEWVAGSARAWPGAGSAPPGCLDVTPPAGSQGVLRGASCATRRRWHHPKARRYAAPGHDDALCGFRSCAL